MDPIPHETEALKNLNLHLVISLLVCFMLLKNRICMIRPHYWQAVEWLSSLWINSIHISANQNLLFLMPVEQNGKKETSRERKRSHTNCTVLSYYIQELWYLRWPYWMSDQNEWDPNINNPSKILVQMIHWFLRKFHIPDNQNL
jgi:hypothetical protein